MTSTELAVRGDSLESKIKYAQALAGASLLPKTYLNNPANVLLAVELGESLGITSIQAINGIHVIEGKPSASADLIASLVRRAGHKLRVSIDDAQLVAVAQIVRADDPDFTFEARWDMPKAQAAGLVRNGGNWQKHPGQMLRSRAITEVCRMGASDALYGVVYTPEELGADTDSEGNVVVSQVTPPQGEPQARPPSIQAAIAAREVFEVVPDQPEPEPEPAPVTSLRTDAQAKKLAVLMRELGMDNRDEALAYFGSIIGHAIESTKELTKSEASKVIDTLASAKDTGADPQTGEVVDAEVVDWPEPAPVGGAA